jgi:IS30 family transposase
MTRTYQQLTYEQRCQISVLNKSGCSQRHIADSVGTSQPTVSRELARNTGGQGYRHKQAQEKTERRRAEAVRPTKMTLDMITVIEAKLREDWSPEQISGWFLFDQETLISHESIYLHVWTDKRAGGDLCTHLRRQGKKYDKRRNGKSTVDR